MLVASAILMFGCSDDLELQSEKQEVADAGQTIRIGASLENGGSRLAYSESDNKVTLWWEEEDVLKVLNSNQGNSMTDFALAQGKGLAYGVFEGTPTNPYTEGDVLHALFHNNLVNTDFDSDGNVKISLAEQDGCLKEDYQLMYGSITYNSGNKLPELKLKHLTSVLKVTIPTDKTLKKLVLSDGSKWSNNLRSQATLIVKKAPDNASNHDMKPGDLVYYDNNNYNQNSQVVVEGTFVPNENGEVELYVYVLSAILYGNEWKNDELHMSPSFTVTDEDGKEYVGTVFFEGKNVEPGKMYSLSTGIFSLVDFASGDGTNYSPYVISNSDQLYSMMLRCNSKESYYVNAHYKLSADIELDGSIPWTSFDFSGTFDGGGHVITGVMDRAMFNEVREATIKNLTLNLEPLEYTGYQDFGRLAKLASNTSIINCINKSGLTSIESYGGSADIFGGLVAILENNSKMIACANTADISAKSRKMLGGLVGCLRYGATMEACYSTGNLTVAYEYQYDTVYIGGLVGIINEETNDFGPAKMTSCWNNMVVAVDESITNYQKGDVVGYGTEGTDYFSCYKVASIPDNEQISAMNKALSDAGSTFKFDDKGTPIANSNE